MKGEELAINVDLKKISLIIDISPDF